MSVHEIEVQTIDEKPVKLSAYKGKALLIVNTASECGYTPQYEGLEKLYQAYKAKGFEVLAFPSNDFGAQEPGSNQAIKKFCALKYKTTFPLFAKLKVTGDKAHPLYAYLQGLKANGGAVDWNFEKFIVSADGQVTAHLKSDAEPLGDQVKEALEQALPKKAP